MYSDDEAAALYDVLNPWGANDAFHLALALDAESGLDVGCGTGTILHRARDEGHTGRLTGLDPDPAMLRRARRRDDVEWVEGTAASIRWEAEFELAFMTGHAFQLLVAEDELRHSLAAIRRALRRGGRFAFDTRNPAARAWEGWHGSALDAVDAAGRRVCVSYDVESVEGDVVTLTETTSDADGTVLRADRASLRFLDRGTLGDSLADAGLQVEATYGDFAGGPFEPTSEEIVTIARRSD
jgi:SAM-dependent methyltransferase